MNANNLPSTGDSTNDQDYNLPTGDIFANMRELVAKHTEQARGDERRQHQRAETQLRERIQFLEEELRKSKQDAEKAVQEVQEMHSREITSLQQKISGLEEENKRMQDYMAMYPAVLEALRKLEALINKELAYMGSSQSKQADAPELDEKLSANLNGDSDLVTRLANVSLEAPSSTDGSLTYGELKAWDSEANKDPKVALSRTVLDHTDMSSALISRSAKIADAHVFNTRLTYQADPITNQLSSGRCWLFASTNVIRYDLSQKLRLKEFQLSQSYLFFYDKLEKSNYFLELSIELADLPLDSRLVSHISSDPIGDGGQLDMAVNLLEDCPQELLRHQRYGVVPQSLYPESYSSSYSSRLDRLLTTKLREYSLSLRALVSNAELHFSHLDGVQRKERVLAVARKKKEEYMSEVYRILTVTLGVPPKPDEKFTFEYYDVDEKFHTYVGTPVEFYKQHKNPKYSLSDSFSLVNDPRNPFATLFTVDKLGNVWGGRPVTYVNTTSEKLKDAVIASIKAGHPVFFGCDVGQSSHSGFGIMDTSLYEYENAFNIKLGLTKAQRLQTGESAMTHAMVITAVHLDDQGKPVRYRVENSWGPAVGDKGYFVMSDSWFDEFVYQVVVPRKLAAAEHIKVLDGGNPHIYPPWDPMGTLA
ncbi:hypothetical protein FRB99_007337 [Tulasnella sp. 403]|nr:hypothetical protein FRB99_007337 [Tulasnella sp. 403]